ncbi:MAG: hypothetical protein GX749_01410 [Ruminococcaceae bacterium]|nr:hypothetical protein [Oscillospiraceae bacterium]
MKKSVKTLMSIPEGHVVLSKETAAEDTAWISQAENGYEFRLAEYTDGTTALYQVNPDGSIDLDNDSVLVRKMFCLHCGEQMNTALDAATGTPDPYDYYCAACGRHIEISREDE